MSEKPEALEAAESLEQAIQLYSAALENSDNHMTLLAFSADKFRRLHAENERLHDELRQSSIDITRAEVERLKSKNERLREALKVCLSHWLSDDNPDELQGNVARFKELCDWNAALRREET